MSKDNRYKKYYEMIKELEEFKSVTWFDIALFFDKVKENRKLLDPPMYTERNILNRIQRGIVFITFYYAIDGVTIEIAKYAKAIENVIENATGKKVNIFLLAEAVEKESKTILSSRWKTTTVKGAGGFVEWDGYIDYFKTKLTRGSREYNSLIRKIWNQVKELTKTLGEFVINNDIQLLFPVNICSNPGNVPLCMSIVLLSEYLSIPVFNSNHDFYWEDGEPVWEKEKSGKKGIRDHFFLNADIGEIFSFLENIFPWKSPLWFHTTINHSQYTKLIDNFGFSPSSLSVIPTVIDTEEYRQPKEYECFDALERLQLLFSGGSRNQKTKSADDFKTLPSDWLNQPYPLFLGAERGIRYNLLSDNLIFLQPTRILPRKRIELCFLLIESLLNFPDFKRLLNTFPKLCITLLVTGPVTKEHFPYIGKIIRKYSDMLSNLEPQYRKRIFLGFRFGIESNLIFEKLNLSPLAIHEIYTVANLVLLPSQQEGRGLPIIEASACGIPVLANRYCPQEVFAEVIGESLDAGLRLNVLDFPLSGKFPKETLQQLSHFFSAPHYHSEALLHNISVVQRRFCEDILEKSFKENLRTLAQNLKIDHSVRNSVARAFDLYKNSTRYDKAFDNLTLSKNRKYLPGITKLENMVYLKSLIDPSYFRMEEKFLQGRIFRYAYNTIQKALTQIEIPKQKQLLLYKRIQYIFEYFNGKLDTIVDHSLSYRHRHNKRYPYRELTEPELRGVAGILLKHLFPEGFYIPPRELSFSSVFMNFRNSIQALVGTHNIAIDDSSYLEKALKSSKQIAWFTGISFTMEALIFIERTFLFRFSIDRNEKITEKKLDGFNPEKNGSITLFVRREYYGGHAICFNYVKEWLKNSASQNIRLLYKKGFLRIIKTNVISDGAHLAQLGSEAQQALLDIKRKKGFVVSVGNNNMLTFDLLDIPRYHLGVCSSDLLSNFLGVNKGQGYILRVPAGLRPGLSYPTPIQTPNEFSQLLNSKLYKKCCDIYGETEVLKILRDDADNFGTPVKKVLTKLVKNKEHISGIKPIVESKHLTGLHDDKTPWSGAYARATFKAKTHNVKLYFTSGFSREKNDTVFSIIKQFGKGKVVIAWNGGYILNPELVGKLGLPENYIGTPLGLLIRDSKIISIPLYNKPALVFNSKGIPVIKEANLFNGLKIEEITFSPSDRNNPSNSQSYFDLLYPEEAIPSDKKTVFRFAGNKIIEIIKNKSGKIQILPVGLTVSFKSGEEPDNWNIGKTVRFTLPGWEGIPHAIEAGPRCCRHGKVSVEIEEGGWSTPASIKTQAARVDYTYMRGPKIGVGISKKDELIVFAVNGRIRESEGATHTELASILTRLGAYEAMEFDPGGSVTLIVDNKQLNITPYNKDYLKNPFSLPPQPRFVGNAILGYIK